MSDLKAAAPRHRRKRRRPTSVTIVAASILVLVVLLSLLAPLIAPYPYDEMVGTPYLPPFSDGFLLGTDRLGRDVLSRLLHGGAVSLSVGIASQIIALAIGVTVGAIAGARRSWLDSLLMRGSDVAQALPVILIALLFLALFGNSTIVLIIGIGISSWPPIARVTRAEVMRVVSFDYVEAARSIGASPARVLTRHVAPNVTGPILVQFTFGISQAVFTEAFLAFIGLGPPPPNPSWGRLISDGLTAIQLAPFLVIAPTVALAATLIALNFVGDGLRDHFERQDVSR